MSMNRYAVILIIMVCALTRSARADESESLFNGKDLTGWKGDTAMWSVRDGCIVGKTDGKIPTNTFLIWDGTAGDFELHAKFRMHGGNSGIQYRSKWDRAAGNFVVAGYQADMDAENVHTGIL